MPGVRPQPDGSVNVDGSVPIRDLNRAMDWNLPDAEATTIAGLVIHEARSIPDVGQSFTFHGFRFSVMRKQRNRITALRITPLVRKPVVWRGQAERVDSSDAAPIVGLKSKGGRSMLLRRFLADRPCVWPCCAGAPRKPIPIGRSA